MDNIREENLKRLAKFIAEELINLGKETDREEFEKCAIMKVRIMELSDRLGLPLDPDLTNLEDEDEI